MTSKEGKAKLFHPVSNVLHYKEAAPNSVEISLFQMRVTWEPERIALLYIVSDNSYTETEG